MVQHSDCQYQLDSTALKWVYGQGLGKHIKDETVHLPKLATLADYRQEVL